MGRKFHGVAHFKGGFDKLSPFDWKMFALGAHKSLVKLLGEEQADEVSENVLYNTEKTWKERYLLLEEVLTKKEKGGKLNADSKKSLPVKAWWVANCGGQPEGRISGCGKPFNMIGVEYKKGFMKCPHCGCLN